MRIQTIGTAIDGHTTAAMINLLTRDSLWWSKLGVTPGGAGAAPIGFAEEFIVGSRPFAGLGRPRWAWYERNGI